ncbi:Scytalone dehydratase, partial [Thoreauomyces humboldtii]
MNIHFDIGAQVRRLHRLGESADPPLVLELPSALFSPLAPSGPRTRDARRAYKAKSLLVHPDRCSDPSAAQAFRLLQTAYESVTLHGWTLPARAASLSSRPVPTLAEADREMEAWMQRTHASLSRGVRRRPPPFNTSASPLAEPPSTDATTACASRAIVSSSEDEETIAKRAGPEVAWASRVHARASGARRRKRIFGFGRIASTTTLDDEDDEEEDVAEVPGASEEAEGGTRKDDGELAFSPDPTADSVSEPLNAETFGSGFDDQPEGDPDELPGESVAGILPSSDEPSSSDDEGHRPAATQRMAAPITEVAQAAADLTGHSNSISALCVYENRLYSAGKDKEIKEWDLGTRKLVRTFKGHTRWIRALASGSKVLFSGSWDDTIRIWDLAAGEGTCLRELKSPSTHVLYYDPITSHLYSGSGEGRTIHQWDVSQEGLASDDPVTELDGPGDGSGTVACLGGDGARLVVGMTDGTVVLYALQTKQCHAVLEAHDAETTVVRLTPDGGMFTAGNDRVALEWNNGTMLRRFGGHDAYVSAMDVIFPAQGASESGRLVTACWDGTLRVWDLRLGAVVGFIKAHRLSINVLVVYEKTIITAGAEGIIKIWDIDTIPKPDAAHQKTAVHLEQAFNATPSMDPRMLYQSQGPRGYAPMQYSQHHPPSHFQPQQHQYPQHQQQQQQQYQQPFYPVPPQQMQYMPQQPQSFPAPTAYSHSPPASQHGGGYRGG